MAAPARPFDFKNMRPLGGWRDGDTVIFHHAPEPDGTPDDETFVWRGDCWRTTDVVTGNDDDDIIFCREATMREFLQKGRATLGELATEEPEIHPCDEFGNDLTKGKEAPEANGSEPEQAPRAEGGYDLGTLEQRADYDERRIGALSQAVKMLREWSPGQPVMLSAATTLAQWLMGEEATFVDTEVIEPPRSTAGAMTLHLGPVQFDEMSPDTFDLLTGRVVSPPSDFERTDEDPPLREGDDGGCPK